MRAGDVEGLLKRVASLEKRVERLEREELIRYSARVYNDANISIPTGAVTTLTFNSEHYDYGDLHSTVANTSRLTAPTGGIYYIAGHITFNASAVGRRQLYLFQDGATYINITGQDASAAGNTFMSIDTKCYLSSGSYVELRVYQDTGGNLDVVLGSNNWYSPEFMMHWWDV
jgi:hypothetical protein